jgi:hypothetical protein
LNDKFYGFGFSSVSVYCRLPYSLVIRVWDMYLLEGEPIMFAMAYTILKLHR